MDETWAGSRPVDPRTYPYFNPPYRIPFKHIGTQKQLFLDNYILDDLIDTERIVPRPGKAESLLIQYDDLPWERYHFTCVPAAALYDPDDGLFKMWYKTLLSGNTNSAQGTEVVLCYAESDDALNWRKPMRDDCQPFEDYERTNIVVRDFDNRHHRPQLRPEQPRAQVPGRLQSHDGGGPPRQSRHVARRRIAGRDQVACNQRRYAIPPSPPDARDLG